MIDLHLTCGFIGSSLISRVNSRPGFMHKFPLWSIFTACLIRSHMSWRQTRRSTSSGRLQKTCSQGERHHFNGGGLPKLQKPGVELSPVSWLRGCKITDFITMLHTLLGLKTSWTLSTSITFSRSGLRQGSQAGIGFLLLKWSDDLLNL